MGLVEVETEEDFLQQMIKELLVAVEGGKLEALIKEAALPKGDKMAANAQAAYAKEHGISNFDPWKTLSEPGDTLASLLDIEYAAFRKLEYRLRAAQILLALSSKGVLDGKPAAVVGAIVNGYEDLVTLFKSMRGARASRAGTAFELHIKRILQDGKIPFDYQSIIDKRSPDFVLPSLTHFTQRKKEGLILTAKTTTRERWQQILNEGNEIGQLFLATLDRTITDSTLTDMDNKGITLVVPEAYLRGAGKEGTAGVYKGKSGVVSFRGFLDNTIAPLQVKWL